MEKIIALIDKLQELKNAPDNLNKLSYYTQMLYAEILHVKNLHKQQEIASKTNVSVILPGSAAEPGVTPEEPVAVNKPVTTGMPEQAKRPAVTTPDPRTAKEWNETVNGEPSLNDKLRQQQTELAEKLSGSPVKDLRNAIGINDKFRFIQELFRGDKELYDRSIATLNSFTSRQEAVHWLQRELTTRLGWQEDGEAVNDFYSIVKKRFSAI